jgi:hypothetical protein
VNDVIFARVGVLRLAMRWAKNATGDIAESASGRSGCEDSRGVREVQVVCPNSAVGVNDLGVAFSALLQAGQDPRSP